MRRFVGLLLSCAMVVMALFASTAFAAATTEIAIAQIRQDGGNVLVYLTGTDKFGNSALDTAPVSNYKVTMNGQELRVTGARPFSEAKEATHYIVCVDVSGSIGGGNFTADRNEGEEVKAALRNMIGSLQPNEAISMFTFGDSVKLVADFPKDVSTLYTAVDGLTFRDQKTALYEVIYEATNYAQNHKNLAPRTAVLIITDGTDDANGGATSYTFDSILENVRACNVPVYTGTFFRDSAKYATNAGSANSFNELAQLATVSGGRVMSLTDSDGSKITNVMQNLQNLTRNSTVLTAVLDSTMEHGDGDFKVTMETSGSSLTTADHNFVANWDVVPTPTPVPVLDKLEINDITEDSTVISGATEPGAHVTIERNGETWTEFATADGRINFKFGNQLSDRMHLKEGDIITISARDAFGITTLPNGDEGRVNKTVGKSSRDPIVVRVDNVESDEITVYGDVLTVRGTAEENTQVIISWVPDGNGEQKDSEPIATHGKIYNYSFNADECQLGKGTVVVMYADYVAYSCAGNLEGAINWIREKPVEAQDVKLEVSAVSEDTESLIVHTEPGAEITLTVDNKKVNLGENGRADDQGNWSLPLVDNADVTFKKGKKLQVAITDTTGRTRESDPITIEGSDRRDINVSVSRIEEDVVYGEKLQVKGNSERDVPVRVEIREVSTGTTLDIKDASGSGVFTVEFDAEECGVGDAGTECFVIASYGDNLGDSKSAETASFIWYGHEKVVKQEAVLEIGKGLREDSKVIHIRTEPRVQITIRNVTEDRIIDDNGVSDGDGNYDCPLGVDGKAILTAGDEIEVTIVDADNEEKTETAEVGEARRQQITVGVKDLGADGAINQEAIQVRGYAEPGERLIISWVSDGNDSIAQTIEETATPNGTYIVELSKEAGFTGGTGSISVSYADGLAVSKGAKLETNGGIIEWDQTTPSPAPVTPTPTPSPTPTPEERGVRKIIEDFIDEHFGGVDNMLRDWRFWAIAAAALLLLVLIIVLIVVLARKGRKNNREIEELELGDDQDRERIGENAQMGTTRQKLTMDAPGATARMGANEDPYADQLTGTMNMTESNFDFDSGADAGMNMGDGGMNFGDFGGGTVRLTPQNMDLGYGGTVRLNNAMGPQPLNVRIHESRDWEGVSRDVVLPIMQEATIGRSEGNAVVIRDETVSGVHLKLIRRDNQLFVKDNQSSNGTQLNGVRVTAETPLNSGDRLIIGRTNLTIEYDG